MDKLHDALCVQKFNRNDNEDFSLFYLRIIAVLEGKKVHGVLTEGESIGAGLAPKAYILRTLKLHWL